jgi:RNA polymerase sigma factor (TIGR02999 family)
VNQKQQHTDAGTDPDQPVSESQQQPPEEQDLDHLLPLVYEELKRLAHVRLMAEPAGHTLNTTGLVHEAYLRLSEKSHGQWRDRTHFLALASIAMRRILIDYARRHHAAKRGGDQSRIPLDAANLAVHERAETLIELDEALTRLAQVDQQLSRVVECRFFGGMTEEETAQALGVTSRTVRNRWTTAKGLLYLELSAP